MNVVESFWYAFERAVASVVAATAAVAATNTIVVVVVVFDFVHPAHYRCKSFTLRPIARFLHFKFFFLVAHFV